MIRREDGHNDLLKAVAASPSVSIGAPTLFEAGMILASQEGLSGYSALARFVAENEIASISFDDRHRSVALDAFIRYGKGRHRARLNLGDCLTYATASLAGEPLLFVGDDFGQTDLTPALA